MLYQTTNRTVRIGNVRNPTITATSEKIKRLKSILSTTIKTDLIMTPITLEKRTKPGRYSFLSGFVYVLINNGSENNCRKALLHDKKNLYIL